MSHVEEVLKLIALEMAHARLEHEASETGNGGNAAQANLARVITARAHVLGLAAATMLTAELEYRYRSAEDRNFTPSPEQALRIEAALWADNRFADKYARASLLASKVRVTLIVSSEGGYQASTVEIKQAGPGWLEM